MPTTNTSQSDISNPLSNTLLGLRNITNDRKGFSPLLPRRQGPRLLLSPVMTAAGKQEVAQEHQPPGTDRIQDGVLLKNYKDIWESLPSVARGIGHMQFPNSWRLPTLASKLIQCYVVHCQVTSCLEPKLPNPDEGLVPNTSETATCPAPSQLFELP